MHGYTSQSNDITNNEKKTFAVNVNKLAANSVDGIHWSGVVLFSSAVKQSGLQLTLEWLHEVHRPTGLQLLHAIVESARPLFRSMIATSYRPQAHWKKRPAGTLELWLNLHWYTLCKGLALISREQVRSGKRVMGMVHPGLHSSSMNFPKRSVRPHIERLCTSLYIPRPNWQMKLFDWCLLSRHFPNAAAFGDYFRVQSSEALPDYRDSRATIYRCPNVLCYGLIVAAKYRLSDMIMHGRPKLARNIWVDGKWSPTVQKDGKSFS